MQMKGELRQSPPWKRALRMLIERRLEYGQVIHKSELRELFGLAEPITAAGQEELNGEFLQQLSALRQELLEQHRLELRTMPSDSSYELVPPSAQTGLALSEGLHDLRLATRKMARRLTFIRHEELTDEERRKNADAQAKAAMLAGMIRNARLPAPKTENGELVRCASISPTPLAAPRRKVEPG